MNNDFLESDARVFFFFFIGGIEAIKALKTPCRRVKFKSSSKKKKNLEDPQTPRSHQPTNIKYKSSLKLNGRTEK